MADCLLAHAWWLIGFSCFCFGVSRTDDGLLSKTLFFFFFHSFCHFQCVSEVGFCTAGCFVKFKVIPVPRFLQIICTWATFLDKKRKASSTYTDESSISDNDITTSITPFAYNSKPFTFVSLKSVNCDSLHLLNTPRLTSSQIILLEDTCGSLISSSSPAVTTTGVAAVAFCVLTHSFRRMTSSSARVCHHHCGGFVSDNFPTFWQSHCHCLALFMPLKA